MKKNITLFLILVSIVTLTAQNINFHDKKGLESLLCSRTWISYYKNADSSFSDRIMDSIKFNSAGNFYMSARPKDDTMDNFFSDTEKITGKWFLGSTGQISKRDAAINFIEITMQNHGPTSSGLDIIAEWTYELVDGKRMKDARFTKMTRNLRKPFLASLYNKYRYHEIREIWQERRQTKD